VSLLQYELNILDSHIGAFTSNRLWPTSQNLPLSKDKCPLLVSTCRHCRHYRVNKLMYNSRPLHLNLACSLPSI